MNKANFNGKPIEMCGSEGFNEKYGGLEATLYIRTALAVLAKYPVDMLIFEMDGDSHYQVKLSGYDFNTNELIEDKVVFRIDSLHIERFWFKVDDYGDKYVGTFLFPSEY